MGLVIGTILFESAHPLAMALCALVSPVCAYTGTLLLCFSQGTVFKLLGFLMVLGSFALAIKFAISFLT
jgi:hypothetical protein